MVEDPEGQAPERFRGTKRWMAETLIRARPVQDLDPDTISKLLDRLPSAHHLDGVSSGASPPILMFRLPQNVSAATLSDDRLGFFTWGWPGRFGACMTIYCVRANTRVCLQNFIGSRSGSLSSVKKRTVHGRLWKGR